jgi:hypothetical protein
MKKKLSNNGDKININKFISDGNISTISTRKFDFFNKNSKAVEIIEPKDII